MAIPTPPSSLLGCSRPLAVRDSELEVAQKLVGVSCRWYDERCYSVHRWVQALGRCPRPRDGLAGCRASTQSAEGIPHQRILRCIHIQEKTVSSPLSIAAAA